MDDQNRLPLGLVDFANIRTRKLIYVDKTSLIAKIATQRTPIFFSRPRRFGKSLLISTLSCLFSKGLEYFHGLDLEKMWYDRTYKVVHLDFSGLAAKDPFEFKKDLSETIVEEFDLKGIVPRTDAGGIRSPDRVLNEIARKLQNNSTVVLIDEYDAPLTHHINEPDILKEIQSILNNFYATMKQYTDKFRFIFITGVTRTSHVSIFSAFNNIKDLSLHKEFNALLGFTQDDLERYFDPYLEYASHLLKMSKNDLYLRLKQYYDGFQFALDAEETLYSPWSILNFLDRPQDGFCNYWFDSGGISSLIMQYLKMNTEFDLLDYENNSISVDKNELSDRYERTTLPHKILLFQTGYFTIKKMTNTTAILIPANTEIEDSLLRLYLMSNNIKPKNEVQFKIGQLYDYIDNKDLPSIIALFNAILNDSVSVLSKIFQDERSVRDIIYAALPQDLSLQKIKERESSKGFSDLELLTQKTQMVIEFKRTTKNRDAQKLLEEAIEQMKSKKYDLCAFQNRTLYRVAMVISTENKIILPDFCREVV